MVGSFEWHVKAANLRQFLLAADPVLAGAGIELVVVGRVPGAVLDELRPRLRATQFAGWVERLADVLGEARMAVVDEPVGGGFKMKTLDYVFHHLPVAATAGSVAVRRSPNPWTAAWSTSFGEISSVTWVPLAASSRPTASPGKRCPPVPPQAMATKGRMGEPDFTRHRGQPTHPPSGWVRGPGPARKPVDPR